MTAKTKRIPFRILSIIIAGVIVLSAILATVLYFCLRAPTLFSYGNTRIDRDTYAYWLSCYKSSSVRYSIADGFEDTPKGWSQTVGGSDVTYLSHYTEKIDAYIKRTMIAASLYDDAGYRLTSAEADEMREAIDLLLGDGNKKEEKKIKSLLKDTYGVNERDLRRIALYEYKYTAYYYRIFGNDLSGAYDESLKEDAVAFYHDNYIRFKQIFISNAPSDNEERLALNLALEQGMTAQKFDTCIDSYDKENNISHQYGNGVYLYKDGNYSAFTPAVLAAVKKLAVGEACAVQTEDGTFFLMRYPLEEDAYLNTANLWFGGSKTFSSFASLFSSYIYQNLLDEKLADVSVNTEEKALITLANVKRNWEYNILDFFQ